jgi:methylenetetrahydromethanopterin dehydrogenase
LKEDLSWTIVKKRNTSNKKEVSKMSEKIVKVGILKLGNIASSVLLEMLLDERADRENIDVRTVSCGAKLQSEPITEAAKTLKALKPELILITSPNASLKHVKKEILSLANNLEQPIIVISDKMKDDVLEEFEKAAIGYFVIPSDAMIGARREFLDPVEMAIFNSDALKILAVGGVFTILYTQIDQIIEQLQNQKSIKKLPQMIISSTEAVKAQGYANPYAATKARGALEIAERVADLNTVGCFRLKDRMDYIPQVAMTHEMMRVAAKMADEAREIEKGNNKVRRQPHYYDGKIQDKRLLTEKPQTKKQFKKEANTKDKK